MIPPPTAITLMTTHSLNGSTTLAFPFMDVVTVIVFFFIFKRDTECYAIEMEQSLPVGDITTPKDQAGAFIAAVVLLGNVMLML